MTEKKENFTPGPWERAKNKSRGGSGKLRGLSISRVVDSNGVVVAFMYPRRRQVANLHLIAAAPELLETLDEALELIQDLCFGGCATVSDEECEKASAMLKKGYAALDKARMKNSTPSTPSIPSEKQ